MQLQLVNNGITTPRAHVYRTHVLLVLTGSFILSGFAVTDQYNSSTNRYTKTCRYETKNEWQQTLEQTQDQENFISRQHVRLQTVADSDGHHKSNRSKLLHHLKTVESTTKK